MAPPTTTPSLVSASLADVIRTAGPESQLTWLGDTEHGNIRQQLALMSPETVRAGAQAGKRFMIVEALSDPKFEDWSRQFNAGTITHEQLRDAVMSLETGFLHGAELNQWREGVMDMFVALKANGMQLLSVDRGHGGEWRARRDYPMMAEVERRLDPFEAMPAGPERSAEWARVRAWAREAIGPDWYDQYKDWYVKVKTPEMNERDTRGMNAALERANGQGVLMVWGEGHASQSNDIDEMLGADRVRVVLVFPDRHAKQITRLAEVRTDAQDYVVYLYEGQAGKVNSRNNISDRNRPDLVSADALNGYTNNSMAGLLQGFTVPQNLAWRDESRGNLGTDLQLATSQGSVQRSGPDGQNL